MAIEGSKAYHLMKETKRKNNAYYSFFIVAVIVLVSGILILTVGKNDFGIVLIASGGMALLPAPLLISLITPAQIKISKLYEKRDSERLIRCASEEPSIRKQHYIYYAIAALGDMKEEKAIPILKKIMKMEYNNAVLDIKKMTAKALASIGTDEAVIILRNALINNERLLIQYGALKSEEREKWKYILQITNTIKSVIESLVITNNYNSADEMMREVEKRRREAIARDGIVREEYREEKKRKIKITYVEEEAVCMIAHIRLHAEEKEITACPHCLNIAKTELMTMWLKYKNKCPICRRKIVIEECLQVEFIQKEKEREKEKE